ncbi:MAG TPA: VWA domain-containing protein [Acidimicrobiia bacterium]|nr:VWA domain-containing protein [Acidimicrobiia bacterium]
MSTDPETIGPLLEFCGLLRDEGMVLGTDDAMTFVSAVAMLDPGRLEDVYWAGRATLAHGRAAIPVYNDCFTRFFLGGAAAPEPQKAPTHKPPTMESDAVFEVPSGEQPEEGGDEEETRLGTQAAAVVVRRTKDFSDCTEEELAAIRKIISSLRVAPPTRRTRRHRPSPKGRRLDLRRIARDTMRTHGEPGDLARLVRGRRPRPLVLILDISGSMADYSRNLLQFAHSTRRGGRRVEVFGFGTHLTRITTALRHRDPDEALRRAGQEVLDWAGGTRIGASLDEFVRRYARRGMARGAIVVICSDGLDRGDPGTLDAALTRLQRLCHRIVWMNPMKGDREDYVPGSLGMSVAMPHIDLLWSGHNLESLVTFAETLPAIR